MREAGYFAREAGLGMARNWRATAAAGLLLFLAILFLSFAVWLRSGFADLYDYVEDQLTMKLYVAEGYEADKVAEAIVDMSVVERADKVTGEEQLAALARFFQDKPRLLEAFSEDGAIPDSIALQLAPGTDYAQLAAAFGEMDGIEKVVYPQALAEQAAKWASFARQYGLLLLALFAAAGFLTVFLAIRLALLQRSREIRLKLLLGASPHLVAMQYALEGLGMGLLGGAPAAAVSAVGYEALAAACREQWPAVFAGMTGATASTLTVLLAVGPLFGLLAAYTAVRGWIRHAA
ncbi:cell division protein FtsX [Cohnella cellulosilytica]|uniref:Cell division protein FtsX n=1 Tax=Cohnella cellulosilytica TaxID=986710 RepID=A0ABW2FGD5_9BACL